eukprot:6771558-Alexandrium_andersonii.AAC.1
MSRGPHPRRSGGPATRWRRAGADSSMGGRGCATAQAGSTRNGVAGRGTTGPVPSQPPANPSAGSCA